MRNQYPDDNPDDFYCVWVPAILLILLSILGWIKFFFPSLFQ